MRLPRLEYEDLDDHQKVLHARIAGKRGQTRGPYLVWLHNAPLCEHVDGLAAYLRFECSLPVRLRELAILVTARFWDAEYSWNAHAEKAIDAGISREAVLAIAEKQPVAFDNVEDQVFYDFLTQMLNEHFVTDETYAAALELFGPRGVTDAVACAGNFSMLAMCLNTFEVDLHPGATSWFSDVSNYRRVQGT